MFVRQITSTNPNTFDEHCVALVTTFSSLQTTMCRLWNPDKNDFREKYDFMSVTLTISLFVRRHSIALWFVSTDLPSRMTQQPCPDRFVCAKSFTAAKSHLAVRTNRPAWIARSARFDAELCFGVVSNFTKSPAMCFTLFARATVAGSPSRLNRTGL